MNRSTSHHSCNGLRPRRSGFTLIEVLVATAITVLLAVFLLGVTLAVLKSWNRSSGRLSADNQARLALNYLTEDLQGAVFRNDGGAWMIANYVQSIPTNAGWVGAASVSRPLGHFSDTWTVDANADVDSVAGVWLRFITTRKGSNADLHSISAPTAVSYRIVRRTVSGSPRYLLFRAVVRPGVTSDSSSSNYKSGTFFQGYDLTTYTGANATEGDPGNVVYPPSESVLAENVIDFSLRFYVWNGSQLVRVFPDKNPPSSYISTAGGNQFPAVVDVSIRILTDEGAKLIANLEDGVTPGTAADWWKIAKANSVVFRRRIEIMAKPL